MDRFIQWYEDKGIRLAIVGPCPEPCNPGPMPPWHSYGWVDPVMHDFSGGSMYSLSEALERAQMRIDKLHALDQQIDARLASKETS